MPRILVLFLFCIAVFLISTVYGMTFLLPDLFAQIGADVQYVGEMLVITAATTIAVVYYSGHLSDYFGRLKVLGMAGLSVAIALGFFGTATETGWMNVVASACLGVGWGAVYALGPVVLTKITKSEERVRLFSLYSVFLMAGFGMAPVVSAWLLDAGYELQSVFILFAVLCVVGAVIYFILILPIHDLTVANAQSEHQEHSSLSFSSIVLIMRTKAALPVVMVFLGASVFAGMSNFQTVFASEQGLDYADYFLYYTVATIVCRIFFAGYKGGKSPYLVIALLQYVMAGSVLLFMYVNGNQITYIVVAVLFAVGYGASYPILAAMAANDAQASLAAQTLQLFSLSYFVGIFGFPYVASWFLVEVNVYALLVVVLSMAFIEATLAMRRSLGDNKQAEQVQSI